MFSTLDIFISSNTLLSNSFLNVSLIFRKILSHAESISFRNLYTQLRFYLVLYAIGNDSTLYIGNYGYYIENNIIIL